MMKPSGSTGKILAIFNYARHRHNDDLYQSLPAIIHEESVHYSMLRKKEFLAGRWLLQTLMAHYYHYTLLPPILSLPGMRPVFEDCQLPAFNISHNHNLVIVALGEDTIPLGIDLEMNRPFQKSLDLAQHCFTEMEYYYLCALPPVHQIQYFWRFWTIRESLLKLHGTSIVNLRQLTLNPANRTIGGFYQGHILSFMHHDYLIALATTKPEVQRPSLLSITPLGTITPMPLSELMTFTPESLSAISE